MVSDLEELKSDALAPFQNGYDGVLEALELALSASHDAPVADVRLRVCTVAGNTPRWSGVRVTFSKLDLIHIAAEWFAGGGRILYDGARLLHSGDRIVLDLDPGTAWLTTSAVRRPSQFLLVGSGKFTMNET